MSSCLQLNPRRTLTIQLETWVLSKPFMRVAIGLITTCKTKSTCTSLTFPSDVTSKFLLSLHISITKQSNTSPFKDSSIQNSSINKNLPGENKSPSIIKVKQKKRSKIHRRILTSAIICRYIRYTYMIDQQQLGIGGSGGGNATLSNS